MLAAAILSVAFIPVWQFSVFMLDVLEFAETRAMSARIRTAVTYFIGLAWVVWGLERTARKFDLERLKSQAAVAIQEVSEPASFESETGHEQPREKVTNPLDPEAWYYEKKSKRLNQSVAAFLSYSLAFFVAFLILTQVGGCEDIYEMPI